MHRDLVLPVLRQDQSARVVVLPGLLVLCALYTATAVGPALRGDGLSAALAAVVVGVAIALALATIGSLVVLATTMQFTQAVPLTSRLFAPGLVLPAALALYGISRSTVGLPPHAALAIAGAGAVAVLVAIARHRHLVKASPAYRLIVAGHPVEAQQLIAACREELSAPSLAGDRRSAVELFMASAIADLSMLADRYDDLPEAEEIVARSMATGNAAALIGATMSIVPAIVSRARWTGDVSGLEETLELAGRTISNVPTLLPMAERLLVLARARGLLLLWAHAYGDDDAAADRLLDAALEDVERALALTQRWTWERADLTIELASITWRHPARGGLDAAIDRCRAALRALRLRPLRAREAGYLTLADLLAERAFQESDRQGGDLAGAVRLCEIVARRGVHPERASGRLPGLLDASGAAEPLVAAAFRRAFASLSAVSFAAAAELASEWATWAHHRRNTTEAAEAHLRLIKILVTESQRLRLRGEPRRLPWEVQALTADAGSWLLAAGRRRDAALVLDLGAGVALYEKLHRGREDVEQRLNDAGREDLAERLGVGERMLAGTPVATDETSDASETRVHRIGGQSFRGRFSARDRLPLADYERLVREIARVPGFDDVDAPPTYEDLRAAAGEGPLVYVAATADGGYAVVVTDGAVEPDVVRLPGLTSQEVHRRAVWLLDAGAGDEAAAALESTLGWLRGCVVTRLALALPASGLVTLIPLGALGLLPLHAAGMAPLPDGRWRDGTGGLAFRYAPNARLLARAQAATRRIASPDLRVAALPAAQPASTASPPSLADVCSALGDAAVWNLACGMEHDPVDPLASCLRLDGGPLALQALLTRERDAPRLAMLSACRSIVADDADLDELVGLGGSLLSCGVAGVVCSHAVIDQRGATLLMLACIARIRDGADPPRALSAAQTWLSGATNREISALVGAEHAFPAQLPESMRAGWEREREFAHPRSWAVFGYHGA